MWRIEHPEYLLFIAVPAIGIWLYSTYQVWARRTHQVLYKKPIPATTEVGQKRMGLLWGLISFLFIFAAVDFRCGRQLVEAKASQTMVLIALDVSTSMLAEDTRPNRITYAKKFLSDWINTVPPSVRVGLLTFAGSTQVETPPILDKDFVLQRLSACEPEQIMEQGTDLSLCIKNASKLLASQEATPLVLLVTDAEDHSPDALEALKKATELGVAVLPIGVGTPDGAPVPSGQNGSAYLKDESGTLVRSARNDALLQQLADESATKTYLVADGNTSVSTRIEEIRKQFESGELTTYKVNDYVSRYLWFLLPALLALIWRVWKD